MRKIINGKMYDTATEIDWWQNMTNYGNYGYYKEVFTVKRQENSFCMGKETLHLNTPKCKLIGWEAMEKG